MHTARGGGFGTAPGCDTVTRGLGELPPIWLEAGVGLAQPFVPLWAQLLERAGPGAAAISQPLPYFLPPPSLPSRRYPSGFGCTIKGAYPRFIAGLCLQGVTNASLWTLVLRKSN